MWQATGQFWTGAGLLHQGLTEEALPLSAARPRIVPGYRLGDFAVALSQHVGEACTQAGRFAEARQALDEGIAVADKNENGIRRPSCTA